MGDVVMMKNKGIRINIQEHIDKVKAEYEQELLEKKEAYMQTGNDGLFTYEDIAYMMEENESFNGKNVDFNQLQKYNRIAEAARFLEARHNDIVNINCEPIGNERSSYIMVNIKKSSFFAGDVKETIAEMIHLADSFAIIAVVGDVVHINFFIDNIRTE